jgi:protein gp37
MQESDIAWTTLTWNPSHGCSKVSAGCDNCYAERISRQYGHTDHEWTNENAADNVSERPDKLEEPYSIDEPSRIFVNSMSDLFHSEISDSFIKAVFGVMRNCPEHIFQILTKRPGRAAKMDLQWPPNVWIGTSVEDERVTERIDLLRGCDAETLFISFEPLIGPVGDIDLTGIDWVIVGGESGPDEDRREMDHEWACEIFRECRHDGDIHREPTEDDVAFFFKQSSARQPERGTELTIYNDERGHYVQRKIREMPEPSEVVVKAREAVPA